MQLPNIDRTATRPAGTEVVAPVAPKVIPVAPVNPPAAATTKSSASVVNQINPAVQARASQASNQQPKQDPLQGGTKTGDAKPDWTHRKEATQKLQEEPPKEPLSKVLMDQIKQVWSASARVVEIWMQNNPGQNPTATQQLQEQTQVASRMVDPMAAPGVLAKEALTYSPTKIKKVDKPE